MDAYDLIAKSAANYSNAVSKREYHADTADDIELNGLDEAVDEAYLALEAALNNGLRSVALATDALKDQAERTSKAIEKAVEVVGDIQSAIDKINKATKAIIDFIGKVI
jgi:ABC-type transporter Mla subunit MlaD